MTLTNRTSRMPLRASLLLAILIIVLLNPTVAGALGSGNVPLPTFADFSKTIQNGESRVLRGVYVPDVLAFPIVQQPEGKVGYVSSDDGTVTQFALAAKFGNVGLLAHNNLAGKSFPQLAVGQEVRLVYGNGKVEYFVIKEVLQYQALQPTNLHSSFRNLSKNETITAQQMFARAYTGDRHVTFQTCIAKDGVSSWGRLFIIAVPKS